MPPASRIYEGLWIEPTPRRVRAYVANTLVADSTQALLVYDGRRLPVYWFPETDVALQHLTAHGEVDTGKEIQRFDVTAGDPTPTTKERAAWQYTDAGLSAEDDRAPLKDHLTFLWDLVDAWFEEDEEVFVHPRDPYHRVDVCHSSRHVVVQLEGVTLADTHRPSLLFETGLPTRYYIPKQDVAMHLLVATESHTRCPYKGIASYWSLRRPDGTHAKDLVWVYPAPIPECTKIENLLAFYNEKVDITVDGVAQPRPVTGWS